MGVDDPPFNLHCVSIYVEADALTSVQVEEGQHLGHGSEWGASANGTSSLVASYWLSQMGAT